MQPRSARGERRWRHSFLYMGHMGNIIEDIRTRLFEQQDTGYRDFQAKLIPTAAPGSIIGVRTLELKKLAAECSGKEDIGEFLKMLLSSISMTFSNN